MNQKNQLSLRIETPLQGALQGIEMGVAPDGSAFLSQRGVADICGVVHSAVTMLAQEVGRGASTPRAGRMRDILQQIGWKGALYRPIQGYNGQTIHAYPDAVVVAFLQYYALGRSPSERAVRALALLATKTLRELIYAALGLSATAPAHDDSWSAIHERLLMNPVPAGWFSVFNASQHLLIDAKRGGLDIGPHTVPDISIGQRWSAWWIEHELDHKFGPRRLWPHRYPDDHPQARAVRIEANIYPLMALGEFMLWLQDHYLPKYFPEYLDRQVAKNAIGPDQAYALATKLAPKRLPGRPTAPPGLPGATPAPLPGATPGPKKRRPKKR